MHPLIIMTIGIALVIGMIMKLKVNAFITLITAAMVVSLLAADPVHDDNKVADALKSLHEDKQDEAAIPLLEALAAEGTGSTFEAAARHTLGHIYNPDGGHSH